MNDAESIQRNEILELAPHAIREQVGLAYDIAQRSGALVDEHQQTIDINSFFREYLTSRDWLSERRELTRLAQDIFPFKDFHGFPDEDHTLEAAKEESRYLGLEQNFPTEGTGGRRMVDPETTLCLDNILNRCLAFPILEAAVSRNEFYNSLHIFNAFSQMKSESSRWVVTNGTSSYDPNEHSATMNQGMHHRFQLQPFRGRDKHKHEPSTLEIFARPGYYQVKKLIHKGGVFIDQIGLDDAEAEHISDANDLRNFTQIKPGETHAPLLIERVEQDEYVSFFRTPRLTIAYNPNYPNDTRRDPRNTRFIKIGIKQGQLYAAYGSENPRKERNYFQIPLEYFHQFLPLANISRHIEHGKTPPYPAMGYHIDQIVKTLSGLMIDEQQKQTIKSIQEEASERPPYNNLP